MLSTEALVDLGEHLRRHGFAPSSYELIAALRVLARLSGRADPPEPRALAPYLAPVFCTTPEQQQQFFALYASWLADWLPEQRAEAETPLLPQRPPDPPPRRPPPEWLPGLLALLLFVALGVAVWFWEKELKVRVQSEDGQPLAASVETLSTTQPLRVTPDEPVASVPYRRHHLPLKLWAQPESKEYAAAEEEVPVPVPEEFQLRLKRRIPPETGDQPIVPPSPPPFGFSPAGSIPATAPETPAPTFSEQSRPLFAHIVLLIAFLLLLVGGWLWNALRRRGWLERLPVSGEQTEKRLQTDQGQVRAAFRGDVLQLGRELRRRHFVPSAELDVDRTLAATLQRGGLLTPVFGSRVEPEFLVLVDRASLRDHLAQLTEDLLLGLCERGLSVERFVYHRDPARCRHQPLKQGVRDRGAQDLGQLFARFGERRLILFGDGRDLLDPYSGRPVASVAALLQWQRPILVTPRPAAGWGRQEWTLDRAGCTILPLDRSGLKLLGEVVGRDRTVAPPGSHAADRPRPAYLRDLDRLLDPEPPDRRFSERVLKALEQDLPQPVFYWLAGCAVYPEIHWGITLRLGARLIPQANELAESLPKLAQLPWLRQAYLPDWLRAALLAQLPARTAERIRAELDDFLARLRQETRPDATALRIAAGPAAGHSAAGDVWRGVKALFGRRPPVESLPAAEDRVFLRFMSRPSNPLGVRASEALRRLFYRHGLPLAGIKPLPLLLVAAFGVAALQWPFPVRETLPLAGPTPAPIVRSPTALALDADGRSLLIGDSHRGLQAWQETGQGWGQVAGESSTVADAISAVALAGGRMLGASKGGLQLRPAAIGGPPDEALAANVRANEIRAAGRYGGAPAGDLQLLAADAPAAAADELCVAIDAAAGQAWSLGAAFLAGVVGGQPVACAVSQGAEQLAVLAGDGSVFVLPLRQAAPRAALPTALPTARLPPGDWRRGLAVSADGRTLAATGDDGRLLLLRPAATEPTILDGLQAAGPVALSGDGLTLALADRERQVQLWRIEKPGRHVLLTIAVAELGQSARLQSPPADVRKVAEVLQRRYAFEVIRLANPRRAEVLKAFDELAAGLAARDQLVVYLSGFGSAEGSATSGKSARGFTLYFPPAPAGASVASGTLSGSEFARRIAAVPARQILTIVDTPKAGALAALPQGAAASSGARGLLYSAGADQQSNDSGDFSTALANALATAPGPLGGRALAAEVARRVPAEARKIQTPGYADWPAAGSDGGQVLLVPVGSVLPELPVPPRKAVAEQAEPVTAVSPAPGQPPEQQQQQINPTSEPPLVRGKVFRDCPDCPEMVVIPAGEFIMGSPKTEAGRNSDEGPQHRVKIGQPFAVGKYEVTFDEWDACVAAGACKTRPEDNGWGRGRQPVINVSWNDATAYAAWLAKKTGQRYQLLSEAEWEYAARAGSSTPYPWGNEPGTNRANFDSSSEGGRVPGAARPIPCAMSQTSMAQVESGGAGGRIL